VNVCDLQAECCQASATLFASHCGGQSSDSPSAPTSSVVARLADSMPIAPRALRTLCKDFTAIAIAESVVLIIATMKNLYCITSMGVWVGGVSRRIFLIIDSAKLKDALSAVSVKH